MKCTYIFNKKNISALMLCLLIAFLCTSCSLSGKKDKALTKDNGSFIVVVDSTNMELVKQAYEFTSPNTEDRVEEIINALKSFEGEGLASPFPEDVTLNDWSYNEKQVFLYFGSEYYNLAVTDEVLCRAAIVESLCQISGVQSVSFYVDETELTINNKVIGRMTEDTFLYDVNEDNSAVEVTLYFPDDNMTSLTKITRTVKVNGMYTDEQTILTELLNGPLDSEGLSRAIPSSTKILNIVTKDKVCYVNLSSDFLDYLDAVPENITVYSIVNTLTSVPGISSVYITVEGDTLDYYKTLPCSDFLTYNYDLVDEVE
jgi:germination protein M